MIHHIEITPDGSDSQPDATTDDGTQEVTADD